MASVTPSPPPALLRHRPPRTFLLHQAEEAAIRASGARASERFSTARRALPWKPSPKLMDAEPIPAVAMEKSCLAVAVPFVPLGGPGSTLAAAGWGYLFFPFSHGSCPWPYEATDLPLRRSREARAPSWPLVPPGIPKSGCTPQPGTRSQPVGPRRPAWPHHGHSANSPYRALYQTRGMLRLRGPRGVRCHPERLGHLPEDTQLQREGAGPLCLVLGRVLSPLPSKLCCPEVSPKPAQPRRRPVREHGVMSSMVGPPVPLC